MQICQIQLSDSTYPGSLRNISSVPKLLYTLGNLHNVPELLISIVGSRRPTQYGIDATYQLAYELADQGVGIVSGLALGIDTVAHRGALDAGGYTIAVLACGLDRIYPSSNRELAKRILVKDGAIISEQPEGVPPLKHHFIARNRIIAGLSEATLVPEADASSGSLITVNFALEQNRQIMALPGNITSLKSAGPNNLLKNGAAVVTNTEDILATLGYERTQAKAFVQGDSKEESDLLALVDEGYNTLEKLQTKTGKTAAELSSAMSLMEITGKVRPVGNSYIRI